MTGELKPSDVAAHAVVWALIADVAKEHKDAARAQLTQLMGPDAAAVKAVANGTHVGRATWVEGKDALTVVNPAVFALYVEDKHPDEMIRTINPAWQKAFLAGLKVVDGMVIDKTGEPVPGVELQPSKPFVSVRKSDEARATVEGLLSSGRLQLDGITHPELEGEQ